jgi:hypothetical protein
MAKDRSEYEILEILHNTVVAIRRDGEPNFYRAISNNDSDTARGIVQRLLAETDLTKVEFADTVGSTDSENFNAWLTGTLIDDEETNRVITFLNAQLDVIDDD